MVIFENRSSSSRKNRISKNPSHDCSSEIVQIRKHISHWQEHCWACKILLNSLILFLVTTRNRKSCNKLDIFILNMMHLKQSKVNTHRLHFHIPPILVRMKKEAFSRFKNPTFWRWLFNYSFIKFYSKVIRKAHLTWRWKRLTCIFLLSHIYGGLSINESSFVRETFAPNKSIFLS